MHQFSSDTDVIHLNAWMYVFFTAYKPESNLNLRIHKIRINNNKGKSHIFQFQLKSY